MRRHTPEFTPTATRCPYTTRFRSAPSRRSSASAARLKMASAASISMRVKPDSRGLDDDIDPAIRVDFDDYALVLPHKSDASGVDEAGRIECDACDVSALERGARSIGPDVVGERLPIERSEEHTSELQSLRRISY